jgi:hypothetical protein
MSLVVPALIIGGDKSLKNNLKTWGYGQRK